MPTIQESIETALFTRMDILVLDPVLDVAWPNVDFTPGAGETYLAIDHFPNQLTRKYLNGSDPHYRMGFIQIRVVAPLGRGPQEATRVAGEVAEHFPADLALYSGGVKVKISKSPDVSSAVKTDVSWDTPVSVYYEAFT